MLKKILNIEGAQILTRNEQKTINGGIIPPGGLDDCSGWNKPMKICAKNEVCDIIQLGDGSFFGECV